jgi:hypothetical protein
MSPPMSEGYLSSIFRMREAGRKVAEYDGHG